MNDVAPKAMDQALRLLTFRARSEREMLDRLRQKGFAADVTERTVARLRELGLLNDGMLARDMADVRRRGGRGDYRIRQELRKRGLPTDTITDAMGQVSAGEGAERAWAALQKRAGRMKGLDRDTAYRRLQGFLIRQGFGMDETRSALKRFFTGEPEEEMTEP
jgi:regulatory protein